MVTKYERKLKSLQNLIGLYEKNKKTKANIISRGNGTPEYIDLNNLDSLYDVSCKLLQEKENVYKENFNLKHLEALTYFLTIAPPLFERNQEEFEVIKKNLEITKNYVLKKIIYEI